MRFHNAKFAQYYEDRLTGEEYPGRLFDIVLSELKESHTIIDLGAGTGFFSIPLARKGFHIVAIEPSLEMVKIFEKKITGDIYPFINIQCVDWESWEGERVESIICIHSIYGMRNPDEAIKKMKDYSDRIVLIIKADSGTRTLSELIRLHFNINRYSYGFFSKVHSILKELELDYNKREIKQTRDSIFFDINKEAEYYCYHLGIEKDKFEIVRNIIEENSERFKDKYIFRGIYRDILIVF